MRRFHVARAVSVLALTCLAPIGAHAQTEYGSIQGTVTDTTGAVVPGVTVTLTGSLVLAAGRGDRTDGGLLAPRARGRRV